MVADKTKQRSIKYSSLVVLVIQNTSHVLFMKFALSGDRPKFIKAITVFYGELFKFIASLVLCCISHGSLRKGLCDIYTECVQKEKDFAKVLIPAVVYTIQNILAYIAVENLPSTTYMVTYQLKIMTTALFAVLVLKKRLSIQQWIFLFILFAGIVVVQYDQKMSEDREKAESVNTSFPLNSTNAPKQTAKETNSIIGFIAVLAACVMSGFAGIYFEKIVKTSSVSIWVRNFQLSGPSIIFSLLLAFGIDNKAIFKDGFSPNSVGSNMMQGFDWAVWTTVAISALGGLIVSVVIKFADNILKAFATSFAIILNCILAYFLFSFRPTALFGIGAFMVIGAVFGYSIPYRSILESFGKGGKGNSEKEIDDETEEDIERKDSQYIEREEEGKNEDDEKSEKETPSIHPA